MDDRDSNRLGCLILFTLPIAMFFLAHTAAHYSPPAGPTYIEGRCTGKQWIPEHTTSDTILIVDGSGVAMPIITSRTIPDAWKIEVDGSWHDVKPGEFMRAEIGKQFSNRPLDNWPSGK